MVFKVYLSGEIHSDWRNQIKKGAAQKDLKIEFYGPVTNHEQSDQCGARIIGEEDKPFWADHKSAKINAIRTRTYIEKADIVVARFGNQYKQWNAAFDAGFAAALNKPLIVMHSSDLIHPLKEVDAAALAVVETPAQVVDLLTYVLNEQ